MALAYSSRMRQLSQVSQRKIRDAIERLPDRERESFVIKMIARDFYLYCERNLMIKDKVSGAIVPLELNWAQKTLVDMVLNDLLNGRPVRYIILKARQMGLSTIIEALCYWWTSTHRNISSVIIAHEKEASKNLYEMFRRYYANSYPAFQPQLKYNTKNDLTFDASDDEKQEAIMAGKTMPGLGSRILTLVAKEDAGRSGTNHFFHGSEVAAWEDSADVISGALQTVPIAANTFAFLESTAKGVGGYFFQEWMSAEKGESQFTPFFLAWHDHEEYELDPAGGLAPYTDREKALIIGDPNHPDEPSPFEKKNLNPQQMQRKISWRRRKMLDFKTDPQKFDQEYPDTPMIAFLSSGSYAFPVNRILQMQDMAKLDTSLEYGEIVVRHTDNNTPYYVFESAEASPLKVWELATPGVKYCIGVDVAEGIEVSASTGKEGDYSVIDVMDVETRKTVARWRAHIDPDLLGDVVFDLGMYYNVALVGVEANNHGIVTIQKLRNRFYRNLYHRETSEEEDFQTRTTLLGWLTTRKTKAMIIKDLAAAIRDGDIEDFDPVFLGEALVYVSNDRGQYGGKENGHDDTVMAKAINLHLAEWSSYDVDYAKANIHKNNSSKIKLKNATTDDFSSRPGSTRAKLRANRAAARSAAR